MGRIALRVGEPAHIIAVDTIPEYPMRRCLAVTTALFALITCPTVGQSNDPTLIGSWDAQRYVLQGGEQHVVSGKIFFTDTDWLVLFFVHDEAGAPRRGSSEGGTYTLRGTNLTFRHLYNLSVGDALPGLAASELQMTSRPPEDAPAEPSTIAVDGPRLTIFFPSGNRMEFRRP